MQICTQMPQQVSKTDVINPGFRPFHHVADNGQIVKK